VSPPGCCRCASSADLAASRCAGSQRARQVTEATAGAIRAKTGQGRRIDRPCSDHIDSTVPNQPGAAVDASGMMGAASVISRTVLGLALTLGRSGWNFQG